MASAKLNNSAIPYTFDPYSGKGLPTAAYDHVKQPQPITAEPNSISTKRVALFNTVSGSPSSGDTAGCIVPGHPPERASVSDGQSSPQSPRRLTSFTTSKTNSGEAVLVKRTPPRPTRVTILPAVAPLHQLSRIHIPLHSTPFPFARKSFECNNGPITALPLPLPTPPSIRPPFTPFAKRQSTD